MTECNKSVYLANKSIDKIDAVNKGYEDGYNKAIDKCLEIVKFHKDNWDGIEWAIRDIEELREGGNNGTDNQ